MAIIKDTEMEYCARRLKNWFENPLLTASISPRHMTPIPTEVILLSIGFGGKTLPSLVTDM